ncbi:MAG TPA: hypothetical protein VLA34_06000, partial [Candidatus Krumholzibacterium sp.]|nr:hypothetical protein [Candidatus Krumholzibacterium sp.]
MNSGQNRLSGLGCTIPLTIACLCAVLLPGAGCSDYSPFTGEYIENERPTVELTSGPVESDSIPYYIHFYWIGDDPDGEIDHYEIAMVSGDPMGFDPQDTTGADKWRISHVTDTLILARADEYDTIVTINRSPYAVHDRMHTFFLRAVDDRGCCSETVHRTFNAWNLAPHVFITQPSNLDNHSGVHMLSTRVHFKWFGKDPIDSPWNYQDVDSTRFLLTRFTPTVVSRLNTDPEEFEDLWSKWEWIDEIEGKGRSTIIGDDEILAVRNTYIFAVQAKDEAGARSSIFDERTNVLRFMVMPPTGPMMEVWEQLLGSWNFMGPGHDPVPMSVPPGYDMTFYWRPNADHYA